ncbi:MAG: endopeptidase La [Acidobacteria bacterium]|nr:endopeptidase La [Acidobacteriota bacterium]
MAQVEEFRSLPVLPLKNTVLFPGLMLPLSVGRKSTQAAVEAALATEEKEIFIVSQRDSAVEAPTETDLYPVGTIAIVRRIQRQPGGIMELMVMGEERAKLVKLDQVSDEDGSTIYLRGRVLQMPLPDDTGTEVEALEREILDLATKAIGLAHGDSSQDLSRVLKGQEDPLHLVFLLASMMSLSVDKEQVLLESVTRLDALRELHKYISHEVEVLELKTKIASEARSEMNKDQREYMLRQQMKAIQQELGDKDDAGDLVVLREKAEKANLPEAVKKEVDREFKKLERTNSASPDYQVTRGWIEFVLELPWNETTEDNLDIKNARTILDEDHYELREVKDRILEHLSVMKLNPNAKAPILCFVGPPGVGKTSLGQSIARSLGRKFERMSLGGMHDEAELRGHRRTYIGAMAGRLLQAMRRAATRNPVILLDEVDKVGRDFRGDPAHALLEVLDPEQNKTFRDNYLDLDFDLSKVMFLCTANTLDTIPRPLLDRMEIIRLSGYSEEEKVQIARRYIIPRQIAETGVKPEQVEFTDEGLRFIISGYTREAGLRRLERSIAKVVRKVALKIVEGSEPIVKVDVPAVSEFLGPEIVQPERFRKTLPAGVVTGLAWTESGGDVLYLEATTLPQGKGLTITGQLGEVMQESMKTAQSFIWSHAEELGLEPKLFKEYGLHLHVPAGAIPKDGPSAGVTAVTAMTSAYTKLPVRNDTAMTGEVTLTGLVLPIGGVKEKVLAARRAGMKRVILPKANEKDLRDVPESVRAELEFLFADRVEEVLAAMIPALSAKLDQSAAA